MRKFELKHPELVLDRDKGIIRLKPSYYNTLCILKAQSGLTLGNIAEQCIDFALEHMDGEENDN
ncbi:MAG: hypothetical protein RSC99_06365 [Clostridiales bacterium]